MSELEPNDSRVVHGNAKPTNGDERFAQKPEQAKEPGVADRAEDRPGRAELDDDAVRNPGQSPSEQDGTREDGRQHEQSRDNDAQFEASDLDRGQAQYASEPLIRQQHQSDDWSDHNDRGESQLEQSQAHTKQSGGKDFETGQADYGSAQRKAGQDDDKVKTKGDLSDDNIGDAAPEQAETTPDTRS